MQKPKINAKTKKLLLGIAALAIIAVIVFFFPDLIPTGDEITVTTPESSSTVHPSTTADITTVSPKTDTAAPETTSKPAPATSADVRTQAPETDKKLDRNGTYISRDDVALYIHQYGKLPSNFITKAEAQKLGWSGGGLEKYAPGKSIGGDRFGNYEGKLPKKTGRTYTECDIDTLGASSRGAKRIVFSNDGLVYYTDDHYNTFTLLYGKLS